MINLPDSLRASYVKRWILVNTSREQSVAEHSFNVAMIVRHMCHSMGMGGHESAILIELALAHDLDEVITGDIPTVTKDRYRKMGFEPNDLTAGWDIEPSDGRDKAMIKIADIMEARVWIIDHAIGRHASKVCQMVDRQYEGMMHALSTEHPLIHHAAREAFHQINCGEITI